MRSRLLGTEVRAALVAVLLARTAVNGGHRLVYPFLPEIARGLGISLGVAGALLAVRALAGLAAPLVPLLAESAGRRAAMLAGVAAAVAGGLLIAGAPVVAVAGAGFLLLGLAKPLFDIPMQGWFGARVPAGRLGRVLGTSELTWALSLALALPAGFLIAATSWRSLFLLVAALGAVGALVLVRLIAADRPVVRIRGRLHLDRPRMFVLAAVMLFRIATELLFVVYGVWLEDAFGLSVAAIGVFTVVVVAAELSGEVAVAGFADRVGLRRMILLTLAGSTLVYAGLGLVGGSLIAAVVAVFAWSLTFETTMVTAIPLVTALGGQDRERLLALLSVVVLTSSGVAALLAPQVYRLGGIGLSGLVAAAFTITAAVLVARVPASATRTQ